MIVSRKDAKKILGYLKPLRGIKLSGLAAWREKNAWNKNDNQSFANTSCTS